MEELHYGRMIQWKIRLWKNYFEFLFEIYFKEKFHCGKFFCKNTLSHLIIDKRNFHSPNSSHHVTCSLFVSVLHVQTSHVTSLSSLSLNVHNE